LCRLQQHWQQQQLCQQQKQLCRSC
jgi:hypothetical protein